MPVGRISVPAALAGGFFATTLWDGIRRVLAWYLSQISVVDVVYGSLGAVIIALILLEIGAVILLAGAQVIAEYERFVHRDRFVPRRKRRPDHTEVGIESGSPDKPV